MEREKLLEEYETTLDSLTEKNRFVYSEEFYDLDEFDRQKYQKDKMTTEAHLSSLCNILWGGKTFDNGLGSLFGLSILSSMFNYGGFGSSSSLDTLTKQIEENKNKEE